MVNIKHVKKCSQSNRFIYQSREILKYPQAVNLTKVYLGDCSMPNLLPLFPNTAGKMGEMTYEFLLSEDSHRQLKHYTVVLLNYC